MAQVKESPQKAEKEPRPPLKLWIAPVALGWLVPGGGHFYLKRWNRGALLLLAIAGMFVFGLLMRGKMFDRVDGDLFTMALNYGGMIGDMATGALYFLTTWFGYSQPELPAADPDYGTKFLVCAGLLNILAMIDAYEIAVGKKS
ncbi:MAG: hypothetical protein HY236_13255 [Acidobacteria bacterium]|nr:hypothetical protein [Acidobacteriota bacterium]